MPWRNTRTSRQQLRHQGYGDIRFDRIAENGAELSIQMPDCNIIQINAGISCVSGQYTLISVVSPKNAKGEVDSQRKVMVFVKCDVMEVK